MYYIAICDDEAHTCSELEMYIIEYTRNHNMMVELDVFYKGEEFIEALNNGFCYDVVFLDIELITITGIDIAKGIREEMNNEAMQIIYISSKQQYAMELFKTRPMDFLIKPLSKEVILDAFLQAIRLISKENRLFEFRVGHNVIKKHYKEILYFQSEDRKINLVTNDETFQFYGKLDDVILQLECAEFIRIHKSYLVNFIHIKEYSYDSIKLDTGIVIPISKTNRAMVRQELLTRRGNRRNDYRICD